MKNQTEQGRERLCKAVEKMTDENQNRLLGVLEALLFAQNRQETEVPGFREAVLKVSK
jgi:hypothetical protein